MDVDLRNRFAHVEKALSTLIGSISTANPTPAHATELVAADASLREGLTKLHTHQKNHHRLQYLRSLAAALDGQIKDTLQLLVDTRQRLLDLPDDHQGRKEQDLMPSSQIAMHGGKDAQAARVGYDELLEYAGRIGRFTMPNDFRAETDRDETRPATQVKDDIKMDVDVVMTNGQSGTARSPANSPGNNDTIPPLSIISTAICPSPGPLSAAQAVQGPGGTWEGSMPDPTGQDLASAVGDKTALPGHIATVLDPYRDYDFLPWPRDEQLRRGALAEVQRVMDADGDLRSTRSTAHSPGGDAATGIEGHAAGVGDTSKPHDQSNALHATDPSRQAPSATTVPSSDPATAHAAASSSAPADKVQRREEMRDALLEEQHRGAARQRREEEVHDSGRTTTTTTTIKQFSLDDLDDDEDEDD